MCFDVPPGQNQNIKDAGSVRDPRANVPDHVSKRRFVVFDLLRHHIQTRSQAESEARKKHIYLPPNTFN